MMSSLVFDFVFVLNNLSLSIYERVSVLIHLLNAGRFVYRL